MSQSLPSQVLDLCPMHHDSTETEDPFRKDTEPLFHVYVLTYITSFWYLTILFSYGKLVKYMDDGTSLRNVRQIRRTEYPEYIL